VSRRFPTRSRVASLALIAAVAACAEPALYDTDVTIAPESTARHVIFVIQSTSMLYGLSVFPCDGGRSLWTIGGGGSNSLPPSRIAYGETPPEFEERFPARPLTPGCYRVDVSGAHSARFTVNADGTVTADSAPRDTTHAAPDPPEHRPA
jgi:hypothetical protein